MHGVDVNTGTVNYICARAERGGVCGVTKGGGRNSDFGFMVSVGSSCCLNTTPVFDSDNSFLIWVGAARWVWKPHGQHACPAKKSFKAYAASSAQSPCNRYPICDCYKQVRLMAQANRRRHACRCLQAQNKAGGFRLLQVLDKPLCIDKSTSQIHANRAFPRASYM